MSVVVIGASGYLGRYVTRELLDRGRHVVAFDLDPSPDLQDGARSSGSLSVVQGDMTSFADVSDAVTAHDATEIIQLAYFGTPTTGLLHAAEEHPYRASNTNVTGFNNVLEAARQLGVGAVVSASSTVVYGPPDYYDRLGVETVDEESPTAPASLYGSCKVHNEYVAGMYRDSYGLDVACLRLPLVYGPSRYPGAQPFIVDMFEAASAGGDISLDDGDTTWDLIYERDVGPLFAGTLEAAPYAETAYNVVGHTVTVRELADLAREHGHPEARIEVNDGADAPIPAPLDDSRLREEVGFEPEYDAETAVRDYFRTLSGRGE